jgi:hypothetical protein
MTPTDRKWRNWTIIYLGQRGLPAWLIQRVLQSLNYREGVSIANIYTILNRNNVSLRSRRTAIESAIDYVKRRHKLQLSRAA